MKALDAPGAHVDVDTVTRRIMGGNDLVHNEYIDVSCTEGFKPVPAAEVPARVVCSYGRYRIVRNEGVKFQEKGEWFVRSSGFTLCFR